MGQLQFYSIKYVALDWFSTYESGRISNKLNKMILYLAKNMLFVAFLIPGALLFLKYVNNLEFLSHIMQLSLYANDTNKFTSAPYMK